MNTRPRRPPITLVANFPGEHITITNRPARDELGLRWELTGEYRTPKAGECYWYWHNTQFPNGRRKGCVRRCQGMAYERFHIVRQIAVEQPASPATQLWMPLTTVSQLSALHAQWHVASHLPTPGPCDMRKWDAAGVPHREAPKPAIEYPRDPIAVSGWKYEPIEGAG